MKITKECPVCSVAFDTVQGSRKEKTTCGRSCANTYFRSGENHGNYKEHGKLAYKRLCFAVHEPKCILCGWDISVDVHHIDGDHDNNEIENLVPLCANHHRMAHMSDYKDFIREEINRSIG